MTTTEFGIGVLAERTGLTPATLRAWEQRFDLHVGHRTRAGHRRYTAEDVDVVRRVLAGKEAGLPLQLAVREARDRARREHLASVYGELTRAHPHLPVQRLGRRPLVAVSRAIEEECLARGGRPIVLGAFQEGHRFAESSPVWLELGRTASWCAVVADFGGDPLPGDAPVACDLPVDAPMRREWSVVCLGEEFSAVLSAWEVPQAGPPQQRYESVVSTEEDCVLTAARAIVTVLHDHDVAVPTAVTRRLEQPARGTTSARDGDRLLARTLARLDRR